MSNYANARQAMVVSQLLPNRVTRRPLIDAMAEIPRELFVPRGKRGVAYAEGPIEVIPGRFLIAPMTLGQMIEAAGISPHEVVLQIGCATGYSTAVIARLAQTVIAVEENSDLVAEAITHLTEVEADNAVVVEGPMAEGHPGQAPYDVIFINGGIARLPDALAGQLAEGGRLIAVEMAGLAGKAALYTKLSGQLNRLEVFDATLSLLPGFEPVEEFVL